MWNRQSLHLVIKSLSLDTSTSLSSTNGLEHFWLIYSPSWQVIMHATVWTSFLVSQYSLRNSFWSSCPHPANETRFLSNQYPPQEQHPFQTPEGRAIGTSFLLVSLNGEPILPCSPHTMDTQHCNNTVTRSQYCLLPFYVCWWGEQLKPPDMQGNNTCSVVSFRNFLNVLLYC